MTLNEIRAMFKPGQVWSGKRTYLRDGSVTVTRRRVERVRVGSVGFWLDDGRLYWTNFPLARNVIEARPGYLKMEIVPVATPIAIVELQLQGET